MRKYIYISEHGPSTDDEINLLQPGRHYGWPFVLGQCDLETEKTFCDSAHVIESMYTWTPTIAPCGLQFYNHDKIPEWKNSLLLATLKERDLRILKLDEPGTSIVSEKIILNKVFGRIRDICVSPTGSVYISTSHYERKSDELYKVYRDPNYDKIIELNIE
ncbi:MAG: PQQ-dependent sugar dehydrogenase [Bacteroidetes bacterium]|nr:PQQ-dependent sugar dehydrogenase [Bacteroidota bacterium]